jgi:hypothetical protein
MAQPIDTPKGRYYTWDGNKFVSVTTVISEGIPKPALYKWLVKKGVEKAVANRIILAEMSDTEALDFLSDKGYSDTGPAALGSRVHKIAENIIKGETHTIAPDDRGYVDSFNAFMADWQPTYVETEATVFSRQYGYAGTMDGKVMIDGKTYIMDIKTGKSVWPEVALQLAAYRYADFIGRAGGREDPNTPCNGGLVLHLRPRGYELRPVDCGPEVLDAFLSALDIWHWSKVGSASVLKGAIVPAQTAT